MGNLLRIYWKKGDVWSWLCRLLNRRQAWLKNGRPHRDGDKPALIWPDGRREWWVDGRQHRDGNKPAVIRLDGSREWWVRGHLQRSIDTNTARWELNGALHREGDRPALVSCVTIRAPAIILLWAVNGAVHRDGDKPAFISSCGQREWWIHGVWVRMEQDRPFEARNPRFQFVRACLSF